jgi:hypothetical protein
VRGIVIRFGLWMSESRVGKPVRNTNIFAERAALLWPLPDRFSVLATRSIAHGRTKREYFNGSPQLYKLLTKKQFEYFFPEPLVNGGAGARLCLVWENTRINRLAST